MIGRLDGTGWLVDTPAGPVASVGGGGRSHGLKGFFRKVAHGLEKGTEMTLGSQVATSLEMIYGVDRNPVFQERLLRVGARIAAVSDRKDLDYKFRILNRNDVNAFAVPGGWIYVTSGMMNFLRSDSELAAVLGHEMGHQTCRHSVRALERALAIGSFLNRSKARVIKDNKTAWQIVNIFSSLRFSRKDEFEADRVGLNFMTLAGYDARRMVGFFERMGEAHGGDAPRIVTYFQTHPSTSERVARIKDLIGMPR